MSRRTKQIAKMKSRFQILKVFALSLLIWTSCNNSQENGNNQSLNQTQQSQTHKDAELQADLLGNYHGIQPSYFMKNQYGDDMVINGNKISVPSIDFKFLLKENSIVSLQQTNLEDNSRFYYDGKFKIIKDATDVVEIECSLSDGQYSNPTFLLTINKDDKSATCIGNNEPEVILEKIK